MINLDIIILLLAAIYLFYKLYQVLGTTNEEDEKKIIEKFRFLKEVEKIEQKIKSIQDAEIPDEFKEQVLKIKEKEPGFSLDKFQNNAIKAFEIILDSFTKEDKTTLKTLTSPEMLSILKNKIKEQHDKKVKSHKTLVRILNSSIQSIKLDKMAEISILFESEQINFLENEKGELIAGSKSEAVFISENWVFAKKLSNDSKTWLLTRIET